MKNKSFFLVISVGLILLAGWGLYKWRYEQSKISSASLISPSQKLSPNAAAFFSPDKLSVSSSPKVVAASSGGPVSLPVGSQMKGPQTGGPDATRLSGTEAKIEATFQIGSQAYHLQPNQMGIFPRVVVEAKQKIPIRIQYASSNAEVGEVVVAQTVDGGGMEGKQIVEQAKLDSQLSTQFTFQTGVQEGIYRVAVTQRGQVQTLQFWVGPLPAMKGFAQGQ